MRILTWSHSQVQQQNRQGRARSGKIHWEIPSSHQLEWGHQNLLGLWQHGVGQHSEGSKCSNNEHRRLLVNIIYSFSIIRYTSLHICRAGFRVVEAAGKQRSGAPKYFLNARNFFPLKFIANKYNHFNKDCCKLSICEYFSTKSRWWFLGHRAPGVNFF